MGLYWAKIWCDILRHRRFRDRPDSDKLLAVGLILEAQENTENGVLRNLTAENAKAWFHLKASVKQVQAGLDYMISGGWLVEVEGGFLIPTFEERQSADSKALRTKRWRETHPLPVTKGHTDARRNVTETSRDTETKRHRNRDETSGETSSHTSTPALPDLRALDLKHVVSSRGGVRGGEPTACESVDNSTIDAANIPETDKIQLRELLKSGRFTEATAFFSSLHAAAEEPDKARLPEATG